MDRLRRPAVISNYGVGVDHIDLAAAEARGIAVGNTAGVLEATTADLAFALLLAVAWRVVEGGRFARSPEFVRYDPGHMLEREVHGRTLGIVGLGRLGFRWPVARSPSICKCSTTTAIPSRCRASHRGALRLAR
jgi:glyoxylate reductase